VTGKVSGNKFTQGDFKTPEGIYQITDFIPQKELLSRYGAEGKIYGIGAFVLNFPNPIDQNNGKTGSGIWLHSTNDETRIEKGLDSRGCVVAANNDLKELANYIEIHKSPLLIVQDMNFVTQENWTKSRDELIAFVESWRKAWQSKDIEEYLAHYDRSEFKDAIRGKYNSFATYKKAVFKNPGNVKVNFLHLSLLANKDYATATFIQDYHSATINDSGKKTIYLKKDGQYSWKIISEVWNALPDKEALNNNEIEFKPSQRFF